MFQGVPGTFQRISEGFREPYLKSCVTIYLWDALECPWIAHIINCNVHQLQLSELPHETHLSWPFWWILVISEKKTCYLKNFPEFVKKTNLGNQLSKHFDIRRIYPEILKIHPWVPSSNFSRGFSYSFSAICLGVLPWFFCPAGSSVFIFQDFSGSFSQHFVRRFSWIHSQSSIWDFCNMLLRFPPESSPELFGASPGEPPEISTKGSTKI